MYSAAAGWKTGKTMTGCPATTVSFARPLHRCHAGLGVGQQPGGETPEGADDPGPDDLDLSVKVRRAGGDLVGQGVPVIGRAALDHVGDVDAAPGAARSRPAARSGACPPGRRRAPPAGPRGSPGPPRRRAGRPRVSHAVDHLRPSLAQAAAATVAQRLRSACEFGGCRRGVSPGDVRSLAGGAGRLAATRAALAPTRRTVRTLPRRARRSWTSCVRRRSPQDGHDRGSSAVEKLDQLVELTAARDAAVLVDGHGRQDPVVSSGRMNAKHRRTGPTMMMFGPGRRIATTQARRTRDGSTPEVAGDARRHPEEHLVVPGPHQLLGAHASLLHLSPSTPPLRATVAGHRGWSSDHSIL